jgi:hypothetical protein
VGSNPTPSACRSHPHVRQLADDLLVTSVELVHGTLKQLGEGDAVHPAEATLDGAIALAESWSKEAPFVDGAPPLDPWRGEIESLLAVALPTSVYGGETGARAANSALRVLGREQARHDTDPGSGPTAVLVLHHVAWAAAAYALANDRTDLLATLAEVQVESRYGDSGPVFGVERVRHPEALDRNAGRTHADCREFLLGLELRPALACWRRDSDLEASLAEAELCAALFFARREPDATYSDVIERDRVPEARLRARLDSPAAREDLARLFGVDSERLPRLLEDLYGHVIGPDGRPGRSLFADP